MSCGATKIGGKNHKYSNVNQPPIKNKTKWTEAITRCKYSARKITNSIGPLYSTAYPATTSASVSAWSNGVRFDSSKNKTKKPDAAGLYKKINQYIFCTKTKSWKLADWELKTRREYTIVTKISKEITWTNDRAVPMIAYRDWLSKPTTVKKIFPNKIKMRWYRTIESTFSNKNIEGPQIKFWENISWQQ